MTFSDRFMTIVLCYQSVIRPTIFLFFDLPDIADRALLWLLQPAKTKTPPLLLKLSCCNASAKTVTFFLHDAYSKKILERVVIICQDLMKKEGDCDNLSADPYC